MNPRSSMSCGRDFLEAVNTRVYGNGTQTLVLSHGFGSDQTVWHLLVPFLALYFKVVVFDLVISHNVNPQLYDPGRYSSFEPYAQDLTCILDQLHLRQTIFVGHSMSAMIGCIAAAHRPQLFKHLILLSGSPRYLNEKGYIGGFKRSNVRSLLKNIIQNFPGWVKDFAPRAVGADNDAAAVSEFELSLGRMDPAIALSAATTVFLSDNRPVLRRVKVPCTIIQSAEDIVVPRFVSYYMRQMIGGRNGRGNHSTVRILKASGHFPQLTAHKLLLDVLVAVLNCS